MHRTLMVFLVCWAAIGCATAAPPRVVHVFPVRQYTLPSGLRVVIEQDDTSNLVGVTWVVDVGTADDPDGQAEAAHVVEHLAFRAPDAQGVSAWDRLIRLGASGVNGETAWESTTYRAFVPRAELRALVAIEVARMADPLRGVDQALLDKERLVVDEEINVRGGLSSALGSRLVTAALLPASHPYARNQQLGERRKALRGLSIDDLRRFAERHYRPEKMTLVIAGNIPGAWDKELWTTMPPALHGAAGPPGTAVRRPVQQMPLLNPQRNNETRRTGLAEPEVWLAWSLPTGRGPSVAPLEMLGRVADAVLSSAVEDERLPGVLRADAGTIPGALATVLVCRLVLRADAPVEPARQAAVKFVGSLSDLRLGYPDYFYRRVKFEAALDTALGAESLASRTMVRAELAHDDPQASVGKTVEALQQIGVDQIVALATQYLGADRVRSVALLPDADEAPRKHAVARGNTGTKTGSKIGSTADPAGPTSDSEWVDDTGGETDDPAGGASRSVLTVAQAPGAGAAVVSTMSNGLTLIALRRPGLPFASMLLGFHAEPSRDEPPGVRVAALYARRHEMRWGPGDRGILQVLRRDEDSYQESLSMYSENLDEALMLLSEEAETLTARWPSPRSERLIASWAAMEATPAQRAARWFEDALWGGHVYGGFPRVDALRKIVVGDIEGWFARVRRPANGVLVVVGDIDPAWVAGQVETRLSDWTASRVAPAPPPPPPSVPPSPSVSRPPSVSQPPSVSPSVPVSFPGPRMSFTSQPGRLTAELRFGCFLPPVGTLRDTVVNQMFQEVLEHELRRKLRDEMGASYTPDVSAGFLRGGSAVLNGGFDVSHAGRDAAIQIVTNWFDAKAKVPFDARLMERIRWRLARRSNLRYTTNASMARALFDVWNQGRSPASLDDYPRALAGVTAADLEGALGRCRQSAVISVLDDMVAHPSARPAP